MNIYYCETCGVRIAAADVPQGLPPDDERLKRCPQHRTVVSKLNVPVAPSPSLRGSATALVPPPARGSGSGMAPTRNSSIRVRTAQKSGAGGAGHPSGRHGDGGADQSAVTLKVVAALVGLGMLVFFASLFSGSEKPGSTGSKSSTSSSTGTAVATASRGGTSVQGSSGGTQPAPEKTPPGVPADVRTPVAPKVTATPEPPPDPKAAAERAPKAGPMGFMSDDSVDIREEIATDRLKELTALEKDGKHTPQQLRAAYKKFIAANSSTKAARDVENRLKSLPPPPAYNIPGPKDGLVGCWSWDGNGREAPDRSGHEADGDIDGAERTADNPPALSFDGNGNVVNMAAEPYGTITRTFTLTCWAKPNAGRNTTREGITGTDGTQLQRYAIFPTHGEHYGHGHAGVGISIGTNGISVFEHGEGYMPSPLVYDVPVAGWTHVAVVYDNNKPLLYVNGVFVKEGQTGKMITHPGATLGGSSYGWYRGLLGEVRIYNRALSPVEVKAVFDLGRR